MLPLDDDRWALLTTFIGNPQDLPKVLAEWLTSIGFDHERTLYREDLFDLFLHQGTIANSALAVVPWLVDVCVRRETGYAVEYLTDVVLVEARRLKSATHWNRDGTDQYPEWIIADYRQAMVESRNLVDVVIESEHDTERTRGLRALNPALYGNADLALSRW
jgi:hypothetical protein